MLYDPKWERKSDLEYSGVCLREFIAWLETKDPSALYDFCDPQKCAVAQFLQSRGVPAIASVVDFPVLFTPGHASAWLHEMVNPLGGRVDVWRPA